MYGRIKGKPTKTVSQNRRCLGREYERVTRFSFTSVPYSLSFLGQNIHVGTLFSNIFSIPSVRPNILLTLTANGAYIFMIQSISDTIFSPALFLRSSSISVSITGKEGVYAKSNFMNVSYIFLLFDEFCIHTFLSSGCFVVHTYNFSYFVITTRLLLPSTNFSTQ